MLKISPPAFRHLRTGVAAIVAVGAALAISRFVSPGAAEEAKVLPAPLADETSMSDSETAVFAGGCFWGIQGVFEHVEGVTQAVSGYAGGDAKTAQYETVSTGMTGHAESVEITFDPKKVTYGRLLQVFFSVAHDPTQLNYQGPDHGTQYRSDVFYQSEEQKRVAEAYVAQLSAAKAFGQPIVTRIDPLKVFYAAEDYHQDYLIHNPNSGYIIFNDLPKIANLQKLFGTIYRDDPVMVAANALK